MRIAAIAVLLLLAGCNKDNVKECPTIPVSWERVVPTREPIPEQLIKPIQKTWAWPVATFGEAVDAAMRCNIAFTQCSADRASLRELDASTGQQQPPASRAQQPPAATQPPTR